MTLATTPRMIDARNFVYRGYEITRDYREPHPGAWSYCPAGGGDGPGDPRSGFEPTLGACLERIDELEDGE